MTRHDKDARLDIKHLISMLLEVRDQYQETWAAQNVDEFSATGDRASRIRQELDELEGLLHRVGKEALKPREMRPIANRVGRISRICKMLDRAQPDLAVLHSALRELEVGFSGIRGARELLVEQTIKRDEQQLRSAFYQENRRRDGWRRAT